MEESEREKRLIHLLFEVMTLAKKDALMNGAQWYLQPARGQRVHDVIEKVWQEIYRDEYYS